MKQDVIICLIGQSGTGKTSIGKELEKKGYNIIQSYTTRDPREENEWGHTFVKESEIELNHINHIVKINSRLERMIAYIYYNNNHYWATKEQYLNKGKSIYIIDPEGYLNLLSWNDIPLLGIYLVADEKEKRKRMNNRNDTKEKIEDRIKNDKEAFKKVKTDWVIDVNCSLETAVRRVEDIINAI